MQHPISPNLSYANLWRANLSESNLNLSYAKLFSANLSSTDLDSSVIIGVTDYNNNLKCEGADFKDAIIDDEILSIQLREGGAKNVQLAASSKKELREKLEKCGVHESLIKNALSHSILQK